MTSPDFTDKELQLLAGFVCERYDALMEIANDPNPKLAVSYRTGSRKAAADIRSLNARLRHHYKKGS